MESNDESTNSHNLQASSAAHHALVHAAHVVRRVLNHSYIMYEMWQRDLPEYIQGLRNRQVDLRNLHQQVIRDVQEVLQV